MIGRETRVPPRHCLEEGVGKAAIARRLRSGRRTVYRWIALGQLDRELDDGPVHHGPRARRVSKLDPYKGVMDARLADYPKLSAARLPAGCPAPVATLPPRGSLRSVTFSMPIGSPNPISGRGNDPL